MESEVTNLIQSVEDEESVSEQKDVEDVNVASEDIPIPETTNSTYVNNENVEIMPELIDTLDIFNILNTNEVFSKSDVVFDVTETKTFRKLPPGINFDLPSDNWPDPNVDLINPIQIKTKTEESASFSIANMFPECNNKADIVADADVIKEIFKIPYNKEDFSVMVRKIGNVLLIDNFNIMNFLSDKKEINEYKKYFSDLKDVDCDPSNSIRSIKNLRQQNLHSKFLCKSFVDDPKPTDRLTSTVHNFDRIIYWSFEKIRMILGTNNLKTNLSENGTSRNVSLHIARAEKPLKILNAIDMWLDNLMCDVPEAIICYHTDSFVKDYEYIQTKDIPPMVGSQFSVTKIKISVEKFFSFLRDKEYRPGQVYWLMKSGKENAFKFFNLNMTEGTDGQEKMMSTSFIYECGIISYRFSHYQYYSSNNEKEKDPLFYVSVSTLNSEIHPEIIASANYLIVHLKFSYEIFKTSLFTLSRVEFRKCKKEPESVQKRCHDALANINDGLKCLQYFRVSKNSQKKKLENNIKSDNFQKVNLKFKKDKKQVRDETFYINVSLLFPKKEHRALEVLPTWENINEDRDYWKMYLKFLFYQKAELIYAILFQEYFYYDMFEECLLCLDMMVRCNKVKTKIDPSSHTIPFNFVLIMAGDSYSLASIKNFPKDSICDDLTKIEISLIIDEEYYKINPKTFEVQLNLTDCSSSEMLQMAVKCYGQFWFQISGGNCAKEIDENMNFILRKLYVCNLTLALSHYDLLVKPNVPFNYIIDHYEECKKYTNAAFEVASSPLEKATVKFTYGNLDGILFNISVKKALPSFDEKILLVQFRNFLDCIKDTLQILYDGNNEDCERKWNDYYLRSFSLIEEINSSFVFHTDNQIVGKMRYSVIDGLVSGLKEILKISQLQNKRCDDDASLAACGQLNWLIATNLFLGFKMEMKCKLDVIREHFITSIQMFSKVDLWWNYITALVNFCDFTCYQCQDQFHTSIKKKMENIRCSLKLCYEVTIKFQEIPDDDTTHMEIEKSLTRLHINIHQLIARGIELIERDSRIARTDFNELQTFQRYLQKFQDTGNVNYKLYLKDLIALLHQMGISMKFTK